jgi:hypothetical protein
MDVNARQATATSRRPRAQTRHTPGQNAPHAGTERATRGLEQTAPQSHNRSTSRGPSSGSTPHLTTTISPSCDTPLHRFPDSPQTAQDSPSSPYPASPARMSTSPGDRPTSLQPGHEALTNRGAHWRACRTPGIQRQVALRPGLNRVPTQENVQSSHQPPTVCDGDVRSMFTRRLGAAAFSARSFLV